MFFIGAFFFFGYRASHAGLASGYVDPITRIGAQDEATYTRIALEMVERKSWLTPFLLGRIAFFKPPFLFWLDIVSITLLGASTFVIRLPSLLAAAGTCAICALWVKRERGWVPATLAVILLAGDYYWIFLSSVNMMDALIVFLQIAALYVFAFDPGLNRRRTIVVAAFALGAAILTKSVAALPGFAAIASYAVVRGSSWRRLVALFAGSALVAAPWFVYVLFTHGTWFWREHILTELLGHNVGSTALGSPAENVAFYAQRLWKGDPAIAVALVAAIVCAVRRTSGLLLVWMAWTALTLMLFGFHSATYLLPLVTGTTILAGMATPQMGKAWAASILSTLLIAQIAKIANDDRIVWRGSNIEVVEALTAYCNQGREHSLFLIETDDEFFSAALPLARVSYGLRNQGRAAARFPIDFQSLGVIVTSDQYDDRGRLWPVFRTRLDGLGVPADADPRATEVLFRDDADIRRFVSVHSEIDFLVSEQFRDAAPGREQRAADDHYVFLLGQETHVNTMPIHRWSCRI